MKKRTKPAGSRAAAPTIATAFSARLKAWRTGNELTLKTVAKRAGVSISIVCEWEHGTRFPSSEHLETVARIMGSPVCCLIYAGEGDCVRMTRKTKTKA